jgi:hypothetical protein
VGDMKLLLFQKFLGDMDDWRWKNAVDIVFDAMKMARTGGAGRSRPRGARLLPHAG